jgi:hypothetical protein
MVVSIDSSFTLAPRRLVLGARPHSNRNCLPSRGANNCDDCLLDTYVQSGPEPHQVGGKMIDRDIFKRPMVNYSHEYQDQQRSRNLGRGH